MNDQAWHLRELARRHDLGTAAKASSFQKTPAERLWRSIAITSGKGGVGKSNIALFLASSFASGGRRVLLLDADLGLANVHILLGIAPRHTLADFIEGSCSIEDIITNAHVGFDLLPGATGIEKMANLDSAGLALLRREFSRLERSYDMLILDAAAGIGSTVTHLGAAADLAIVVMTPEPTSLADAYAMVKVLHERSAKSIGIIVNMASSDREGVETFDRLNALVIKFLRCRLEHFGSLPYCREVAQYVRKQRLMLIEKRDTDFARRIRAIARRIGGKPVEPKKGFFDRLFGITSGDLNNLLQRSEKNFGIPD